MLATAVVSVFFFSEGGGLLGVCDGDGVSSEILSVGVVPAVVLRLLGGRRARQTVAGGGVGVSPVVRMFERTAATGDSDGEGDSDGDDGTALEASNLVSWICEGGPRLLLGVGAGRPLPPDFSSQLTIARTDEVDGVDGVSQ